MVRDGGRTRRWPGWLLVPFAALILLTSVVQLALTLRRSARGVPRPALALVQLIEPLRSVNRYGLFAVMTTRRPEIVVEGSDDGQTWKPYEFRWKPGDLRRRPRFVAPHQPRLDWQMWFAALDTCEQNPWLVNFLARLMQGEPAVLQLIRSNPFPTRPPQFVRAVLYDYHFTDRETRRRTDAWWRRELLGLYCPVISRQMLREVR